LMRRAAWAWTCSAKRSWILNDFFTKNYIKSKLKIWNGIGMCLWCCWKDLDEKD
jgi:hypothetical protein